MTYVRAAVHPRAVSACAAISVANGGWTATGIGLRSTRAAELGQDKTGHVYGRRAPAGRPRGGGQPSGG